MSEDFFAQPPFKPDAAHERLARDLRALGLAQRGKEWLKGSRAVVRCEPPSGGATLEVALVQRLAHSPDWRNTSLSNHAQLRDFVAAVKKRLADAANDE